MSRLATISATCLNQFALDFEGNYERIVRSIQMAKEQGSRFRAGPELEICGYNCEDHFYESDTSMHCWEVLAELLQNENCQDILVDTGMPVFFNGISYNCRVVFLNKQIILIRPKLAVCDEGNYRETRWFSPWPHKRQVDHHFQLPAIIRKITGQRFVPFGDALIQLNDTLVGFEICEELWIPGATHVDQTLAGAEIILNGSGSYTEIRKSSHALDLIQAATSKCGCLYLYNNLRGCDGERVYLSGSSNIVLNGQVLALGEQYSLIDVEVLTVTVDLDEIRMYKNYRRSRAFEGAMSKPESYTKAAVNWSLSPRSAKAVIARPVPVEFCCAEEEIARGPALWLWDYLRRSPASGFFVPLSGGVDSASVAIIVYSMCSQIVNFIKNGKHNFELVLADVRKVLRDPIFVPTTAQELCSRVLTTCYMASENSSPETRKRADELASLIGSNHFAINISSVTDAIITEATRAFGGRKPAFSGTHAENLALQNIQARSRMVYAYLFAQLSPWLKNQNGFLLVLGTANVDEAIRGYFTKYDCSAADLNPIGGISKTDLKSFILYAGRKFNLGAVAEIVEAPPTAELQPLTSNQTDEQDMGMTYEELSYFGKLRKPANCGPFSMTARLLHLWKDKHEPVEIARKVKHFYTSYASNRHKMTILTPACHMENYSPEDHRFDLRPFLYPLNFSWQFRKIDEMIARKMNAEDNIYMEEVD